MLNYCKPFDIVDRLVHRHPHWPSGPPSVEIEGEPNTFGKLLFNFSDSNDPDATLDFVIYDIYLRDKNQILEAAKEAISRFAELAKISVAVMIDRSR